MARNEYHNIKFKVKECSINIFDSFVIFYIHISRKKRLRITSLVSLISFSVTPIHLTISNVRAGAVWPLLTLVSSTVPRAQ